METNSCLELNFDLHNILNKGIMTLALSAFLLLSTLSVVGQCSSPTNTFPVSDSFESNIGNWTQDQSDDFNWTRDSGGTTSTNTGPTTGNGGSTWYMYTESSNPNYPNKTANLISECFSVASTGTTALEFSYHMYGLSSGMGTFNIDIRPSGSSTWTNLWTRTGDQGNSWKDESIDFNGYKGQDIQVQFSVFTNSYRSDVAIDDVSITYEAPATDPEICDDNIDNDLDGKTDCEDDDCGFLVNREFDSSTNNWQFDNYNGAVSTFTIDNSNQLSGTYSAFVDMTTATGTDWNTQLMQTGLSIESGKYYEALFSAKSVGSNKEITLTIQNNNSPYNTYFTETITVTPAYQDFKFQFAASSTNIGNVRFTFGLAQDAVDVYVDRAQYKIACEELRVYSSGTVCIGAYADLLFSVPKVATAYSWTGPNGFTSTEANPSFLVTDATQSGVYTLTVTYSDSTQDSESTTLVVDSDCSNVCLTTVQVVPTDPSSCNGTDGNIFVTDYGAGQYEHSIDGVNWNPTEYSYSGLNTGDYVIRIREQGSSYVCRSVVISLESNPNSWYTGETISGTSGCESMDGSINLQGVLSSDKVSWVVLDGSDNFVNVSSLSPSNTISNLKAGQYYVKVQRGNDEFCFTERVVQVPNNGTACPELSYCSEGAINYFPNGDFGSGSATNGAPLPVDETGYSYTTLTCGSPNDGFYAIVNNTACIGAGGQVFGTWDVMPEDHTEGDTDGYMLLVNASFQKDIAIERVVTGLSPNTFYNFTAWIYNIVPSETLIPNLTFMVDGVGEYTTGPITGSGWQKIGFPFYTGNKTTFNLAIRNNQTGGNGNDWVLDDISVSFCKASIETDDVEVCEQENVTISAAVSDPAEQFDIYRWQKLNQVSGTWVNVSALTTGTFDSNQMTLSYEVAASASSAIDGEKYRLRVANTAGNFNDNDFSTVSEEILITVNSNPLVSVSGLDNIEVGETTNLLPSSGGTWTSSNNNVATVSNQGLVSGIADGTAVFTFVSDSDGCTGEISTVSVGVHICIEPEDDDFEFCPTGPQTGDVSTNDGLPSDGFGEIYTITTAPSKGSIFMQDDGTFTYTPFGNSSGADQFTYERCYSVPPNVNDDVAIFNPCGTGKIIDTYIEGIEGESNPEIQIADPGNLNKVIVEVWAEKLCGSVTIEGVPAVKYDVYRTNGALDTEKLYRAELNSVDADGLISITKTGNCPLSSVAAYVERDQPTGSGSSILYLSDIDLYHTYVSSGDDCVTMDIPIGESEGPRNITFTIPLHEKDNTRLVTAEVSAGGVTVSQTSNSFSSIGEGAGEIIITLNAVPGTATFATVEVCSPDNNGDSFGLGAISARSDNCSEPMDQECCATGVATINISDLEASVDFNGSVCLDVNMELTANFTGGKGPYVFNWSGPLFTSTDQTINPTQQGTYMVTITDASGCTAEASGQVQETFTNTINATDDKVCEGESTSLSIDANNVQYIQWSNNAGGGNGQTVTVTPSAPSSTYSVTITNNQGCTVIENKTIAVNPSLSGSIDTNGSDCFTTGSQLTANQVGGTGPFTYSWTGPNSFTATGKTITALESGSYRVSISDSEGCGTLASEILLPEFIPVVSSSSNSVCEGESADLTISGTGIQSIAWSANASSSTSGIVTVTPIGPSTSYSVTVTNNEGCTAEATATINVIDKDVVSVSGPTDICIGGSTTLLPATGGTWSSSNESIATISDQGVVTGISNGTVTFVYTNDITQCSSDASTTITVQPKQSVNVSGPTEICEGFQTTLWPTTGGQWVSSDTNIATVQNNGVVTAVAEGLVTFTFVSDLTLCASDPTEEVTINATPVINNLGNAMICKGSSTTLSSNVSGTWTSDDESIATVNSSGGVTGISAGIVNISFISDDNCLPSSSIEIEVEDLNGVGITGENILCENETTNLSASVGGGTWSSDNSSVATIDVNGLVTAVSPGVVSFTYDSNAGSCNTDATHTIEVKDKPTAVISGSAEICLGETSQLSTNLTGGFWTSSDTDVAVVGSTGTISGVAPGTATFFYTSASGCTSDLTGTFEVHPSLDVTLDFNGSICLTDNSMLSAMVTGGTLDYTYAWTGPNGFTGNTQTVDITVDGNYTVVVTDSKGCTAEATGFIYERYEPFIFSLNTEICEGEEVTLSVNGNNVTSYQWSNTANNSTDQSVTVTPVGPSTTYSVTITNTLGCEVEAISEIVVNPTPVVTIEGSDLLCIGETTQLSPSTGGTWTSSNSGFATVSNSGEVRARAPGTVVFTFRNSATGCYSEPTGTVTIQQNEEIIISGSEIVCYSDSPTYSASIPGGTWLSSNTSIATVNSSGELTAYSEGIITLTYTVDGLACYNDGELSVSVYNDPVITLNGPQTICEDGVTYVNASIAGTWTSSDESVATISSLGVITGVSSGSTSISFVAQNGCLGALSNPIDVVAKEEVSLDGPSEICINSTTNLLPNTGGLWISSNNNIATVSSSGVITGKNAGTATFTFIESSNGCLSDETISVSVYGRPSITGLSAVELCIGGTSSITPTTGGTWESSNTSVATITDQGEITAVGYGSARFVFISDATGCSSELSSPLSVNAKPEVNFTGLTTLCRNELTTISPTSGGQWSSTDVSIATINENGLITAINPGIVRFKFTSMFTGCSSDFSEPLQVNGPTETVLTGPDEICIGEKTYLTPNTGGVWTSSDVNIATITSSGEVTGWNPGIVTFTYNSLTGCNSNPSLEVKVDPSPNISFTGPTIICKGNTTTLSPSSGGTWRSTDPDVAIVDEFGLVTGVGPGTAEFIFQEGLTGCETTTSTSVSVYEKPDVSIIGDDEICIGATTFLMPNTGGLWTSSDSGIATVGSNGQVTGVMAGTVTFTFYETGSTCTSEPTLPVTILAKEPAFNTGDNTLCVGEQTILSPSSGGTWTSNNEDVALVSNSGIVTAVDQGVAKFTFTSNQGCVSNETSPVIVFAKPTVSLGGTSNICIGDIMQLQPTTTGTWESSNTSVATIDDNGIVSAVATGVVTFTYTDGTTGCISDASDPVSVNEVPDVVLLGDGIICIGGTTTLSPTSGGIWTSSNTDIASIQNNGLATGISSGTVSFVFTDLASGCDSENIEITIDNGPPVSITGSSSICIGETTSLSPTTGGTWSSSNTTLATITDEGIVTALGEGSVKFQFTEDETGCKSEMSAPLTINGVPNVGLIGSPFICIGSNTDLYPSSGGTWESLNEDIATVTETGVITAIAEGTAYFIFTDGSTGCQSDGLTNVQVFSSIDAQVSGDETICTGYTTTLSPSSGGVWTSSNPEIASVSSFGLVLGHAPGVVTFTFVDANSGCSSGGTTNPVTVNSCTNNDFNVTTVDTEISGDLFTNDNVPVGTVYSNNKVTISKPSASLPQLIIDVDGSYTFETNKAGKYIYRVPVCIPPAISGCPSTILEINVVENINVEASIVGNLEFVTTFTHSDESLPGNTVTIYPLANDKCIFTGGCDLDESTLAITNTPSNGAANVNADGTIDYTPNPGFIGHDTIYYNICQTGGLKCDESSQVVTVNHNSAVNSIVAADDFTTTFMESTVGGNVMLNDSDPEGNNISVIQQGSLSVPIVTNDGSYYINTDGSYEFTPNEAFSGSTEIVYTVCDDHSTQSCRNATLRIMVFDDFTIQLRVYLEGALIDNNNETATDNRPLMRDDLRVSPHTAENCIPMMDPYSFISGLFDDTPSKFTKVGPGLLDINHEITDSTSIFSVEGENAIVDWVFVEIRDKNDNKNVLATRSGLLQRDGDIVDLDGSSNLRFNGFNIDSFYVAVKHRGHLGVMSMKVTNGSLIDFTSPNTEVYNFGTSLGNGVDYTGLSMKANVKDGYPALWAGDFNGDGLVKFTEPDSDQNILFGNVLFSSPQFLINYDYSYGYIRGDFNMNGKAKYTNPEDDKNYLLAQVLFYPANTHYIALYGNMKEQIPK